VFLKRDGLTVRGEGFVEGGPLLHSIPLERTAAPGTRIARGEDVGNP
jgi:hypothetical protein